MSFDELQQMGSASAPPAAPEPPSPEPASPWDEPAAFGGETRAFPKMSIEEMQQLASSSSFSSAPAESSEPASPWDEPVSIPEAPVSSAPAWATESHEEPAEPEPYAPAAQSYETPAFQTAAYEAPDPGSEGTEGQAPAAPLFTESYSERFVAESYEPEPYSSDSYGNAATTPVAEPESEASPFASADDQAAELAPPAWPSAGEEEPAAAAPLASHDDESGYPAVGGVNPQITDSVQSAAAEVVGSGAQLSESQIDQIARRVVELMSEQVVRSIAWEVIPDVAQMMVKERIRQLESEA